MHLEMALRAPRLSIPLIAPLTRCCSAWIIAALLAFLMGGCGGGSGSDTAVAVPKISTSPASVSVGAGSSATFTVVASGDALTYQWERSTDGGATWIAIAGASASSFTIASADLSLNGQQFRALVQNPAGTATSSSATLSVTSVPAAPVITQQPSDQVSVLPSDNDFDPRSATFVATVSGFPTPTFQWQASADGGVTYVNVAGATGSSFAPTSLVSADSGKRYRVIASNSLGAVTSRGALLTVVDLGIGGVARGLVVRPSGEAIASVTLTTPPGDFSGLRAVTAGRVRTLAGRESGQPLDGTGTAARFSLTAAVVLDTTGAAYVIDGAAFPAQVRKVTAAGVVTSVAGNGVAALVDGTGASASFNNPKGMAIGVDGNLYIADYGNSAIRRVTPAGVVTTVAGGVAGSLDGVGLAAQFTNPWGIAADSSGNLLVMEAAPSCRIRKITSNSTVSTISTATCAGSLVDGPLGTARFQQPSNLAIDGAGNIFVSESSGIRRIALDGTVTTPRVFTQLEGVYTNGPIAADAAGNFFLVRSRGSSTVYLERQSPSGSRTALPQ